MLKRVHNLLLLSAAVFPNFFHIQDVPEKTVLYFT